jgi:hypothetical protein
MAASHFAGVAALVRPLYFAAPNAQTIMFFVFARRDAPDRAAATCSAGS